VTEPVTSALVRVTLFEDRAQVVRKAVVTVPAGTSTVLVSGLTHLVDDASLVASTAAPGARVLASRVTRRMRNVASATQTEVAAHEDAARRARTARETAERNAERATSDEERALALETTWLATFARVPRGGAAEAERWKGALEKVDTAMLRGLDQEFAATREVEGARDVEQRAHARSAEARSLSPRLETCAVVQLDASRAGEVELLLSYRSPCAVWRPEHLARLVKRPDGKHQLVLTSWATAWQRTGEEWKDAQVRFSTARPARDASPPLLREDVLTLRKKTEQEKKTITVEARDQTIALAGVDGARGAVEEMPGVDDGGEPLQFEPIRPVSLPSNGQPVRIEIGDRTLACEVDRVVYPERSPAAHVRAKGVLTGERPLLAGPVRVARGSEVTGIARTSFVGAGEPFELGFGVDDGLRVRRRVEEQRETTAVMGTQKITRTVRLFASNLGGEAKRVKVVERIPVSELEQIDVKLVTPGGATHDAKDGFLTFDVELSPRATKELSFSYKIEASSKVRLPF
jgi:uncharacterized protein (TIGR02231 family)